MNYQIKSVTSHVYEQDMNISVSEMKLLKTLGSVFEVYVPKEGDVIRILCKEDDFKYKSLSMFGDLKPMCHADVINLKQNSAARFINLNILEAIKMRSNYRNPNCSYHGESDHEYVDLFKYTATIHV